MPDYFSTSGNQIVNSQGTPVRLAGVNWFGFETPTYAPDGLHVRNYKDMIDQMAELGFNTIRIPYSNAMLKPGSAPNPNDISAYGHNPDLAGLSSLQILDKIISHAGVRGMRVILDHHRNGAGFSAQENGLWYNAQPGQDTATTITENEWIADWVMLARRYSGNSTVIGADLHNEPFGADWNTWATAATRAANAIHAANPNWLALVEGVEQVNGQHYWWGGNLTGVAARPVVLDTPHKLVYSPHDYPHSIFTGQPWFNEPGWEANLTNVFDQNWGYIFRTNVAPIFVGELGSKLQDPKDQVWFSKILAYLNGDFQADGVRDIPATQQGVSWAWWAWNPNSGDTGGLLNSDWLTIDRGKYQGLLVIMNGSVLPYVPEPPPPGTVGTTGDDVLTGTSGVDTLTGDGGNDLLDGLGGADILRGGSGNDTYVVDHAADQAVENDAGGYDVVRSKVSYILGAAVERLEAFDRGGTAPLVLTGNALANTIVGNFGANRIDGAGGADRMEGLRGNDTYIVNHAGDRVVEAAGGGLDRILTSVSYTLANGVSVETLAAITPSAKTAIGIKGNAYANTIQGNDGNNVLKGEGGNDVLYGYRGNDVLHGDAGLDRLYGGEGRDTFVFDTAPSASSLDRIHDYNPFFDTIQVDNGVFKTAGRNGRLSSDAFVTARSSIDAEDRFIYNPETGALHYDRDGTGPAQQIKFALLTKWLGLAAADFLVI